MDSILSDTTDPDAQPADQTADEPDEQDPPDPQQTDYRERFDITVGEVRCHDCHADQEFWQFEATAEYEGEQYREVSSSPVDAVMGVIEQITGGVV